ncbi:uncharacterized protein PV09_09031 [Verruconis gallopava]|uniref:R3H domain-containing protein n=1 Tax=Verruconis gallopava TaxID=253628 RepID=A0A0D1YEU9_9PEZI|nr:uncharacterized protein PV09_09031 [Verruconis gallopava]KIV99261.1 hypothetical protein PV09_09031 [Verruconis gallopava]
MATKPTFAKIAAKAIAPGSKSITPQIQIVAKPATGEQSPVEVKTPTDDASTHVSSSESSVKMPSFDKQSIASGTTFAMDEKESLRPDDSASIRAIEEEDGPSTGPSGSRVGSDTDARAFSDQLHRIQQIGTGHPRAQPGQRPNIQFGQIPLNPLPETPNAEITEQANPVSVASDMPPVDEKLLEALSSPRDRVFILKIEQDILDFMKNEKELHLTLPDCNSFYRMLSHRLADYYGLDHTHHPRDSGTAVLISKTPHSRVPPPLAGLPVPGTQCNSPPPPIATRKIMRRGEDSKGTSGPSTTANSEGPSKAASETGDGASELGRVKDKSNMTREERERLYAEARLRILGAAEPEPEDPKKTSNDNDMSRSSSASGKKKTKKRKDDDDFEPRSQFPGYYTPTYGSNGYGDGTFYFPQYGPVMSGPQQYPQAQTASPAPAPYSNGYQQVDPSNQMQYMGPQQYNGQSHNNMNNQSYHQPQTAPYDLPAQFQAMSFGNNSHPGVPQKPGGSQNFANMGGVQPPQQGWAAQYDSPHYVYGPQAYPQHPNQSMSSPAQTPATIPYPYGQLPNPALQNGKVQHPLPGSFNRQQFNPQTQAFVPGVARGGPMPMMNQNGNPYFTPFPMNPAGMQTHRPNSGPPQALQHRSPAKGNTGAFPQQNGTQHAQAYIANTPTMSFQPLAHNSQQNHPDLPTSAPHQPYGGGQRSSAPPTGPGDGVHRNLAHPLPQPPNPESSIAKWGTPAHLPAKPPTPTNPHPTKFMDLNKNIARSMVPGLPRAFVAGPNPGSAPQQNGAGPS